MKAPTPPRPEQAGGQAPQLAAPVGLGRARWASIDAAAEKRPGVPRVPRVPQKKTRAELEAELRLLRRHRSAEAATSVVNNLTRWGGLTAIAYFAYRAIDSLAGEATTADIGLGFLTSIKVSTATSWATGLCGVAYGLLQRALRKNTIERLQSRITELESKVDPKRSSSKLTARGDTRPEDE